MTAPRVADAMTSSTLESAAGDSQAQRVARGFAVALHSAARTVRLYPEENTAVQKAIAELELAWERVVRADGHCVSRRIGDYLFVNDTRLRLTLDTYAAVAFLLELFARAGVGGVEVVTTPQPRDWVTLLSLLTAQAPDIREDDRLRRLAERCAVAAVRCFDFLEPSENQERSDNELDSKERARVTYLRSLDATRDVITSSRLGRSAGLRKVKRAVQGIVDLIFTDGASLMGLTTLREFDEYTFVHSVNVCILSVSLGRRLGLAKPQLLDLGLAALLHDIGKARVPLEVLNKRGVLSDDERLIMQGHAWKGVLALFAMPSGAGRPWRAMTAAYEHHMRMDLSGYPTVQRPRVLSLFSKIIAIADGFDAATSTRVYQAQPWSPADVLRGMRDNARLGFEPLIVKAFINLTGIYPVGTLVLLDTFELALVMAANPDASTLSRPLVRIVADSLGSTTSDSTLYDLTARTAVGTFVRTILRTEDPLRYGISIGDYFI